MNKKILYAFCCLLLCSEFSCTQKAFLPNETLPAVTVNCYPGAYYRKAVSSKDLWVGITGTVKLPMITFDESRPNPKKPGQYLDNPSIYLGGNGGGQEIDMGLAWEVIRDENGNVTPDRRAFRPFLRRNPFVPTGQDGVWIAAPTNPDYYFYPGEVVTLSLQLISHQTLKLTISSGKKLFEEEIKCDGFMSGYPLEMKRVNAIDQVGNEGKSIQPTKTKVENAIWYETYLLRMDKNKQIKVPMHDKRFTDMRCPDTKYIFVTATEEERKIGAETITIDGAAE